MKATTFQTLIIGVLLISGALTLNCTVDKCRVCPDTTNITCTSCEQGYYLRTFSGGDKTYNACWKTSKLLWGLIGGLLSSLLCCFCCKKCFDIGKNEAKTINHPTELKSPPKSKPMENNTLLSTARTNRPRTTQLVQQRPAQPMRPLPMPQNPRVQYISPPRSPTMSPRLAPQPYSFGQSRPPVVRSPQQKPRVVVSPSPRVSPRPNTQPRVIRRSVAQPSQQPTQITRPNIAPQPARVVPRITTYNPQGQPTNLGNVRTANPTSTLRPQSQLQPQPNIIQSKTYPIYETKTVSDDDLGVNLTPHKMESEPVRVGRETRAISPSELRRFKEDIKKSPAMFNERPNPPSNTNLPRYGDVQEGQASNNPIRQDPITNSRPARNHGQFDQEEERHNPQNYYERGTFDVEDRVNRPSRSRSRSISPRPSHMIQNEAYLANRMMEQEMIEEPSSPARPFQGGGIASSLGPSKFGNKKMPRY